MATVGFSPEFRDEVEDGRKCRTYRMAKCVSDCDKEGMNFYEIYEPECYLKCPGYEYRIKTGDTIHAYTGLMQRKYCTNAGSTWFKINMDDKPPQKCDVIYQHCWKSCHYRGAKLLRPDLPKCIDTYPIKLKDITEEDARLDGFESLAQLIEFFINTYDAKPDTPIQAIIWEELKGDTAGK